MKEIRREAYAKVNLGLDVIRRRPDGYHEVKMIMQTVGIADVLTFQKTAKQGIFLKLQERNVPGGPNNLVYKTAKLIMDTCQIREGVFITLQKNIPVAAGMAGGSTDAAAVFHGLNELFHLDMGLEEMKKLGVKLGADIPYCIMGGTALSEGIGEILMPLPAPPAAYLAVAKPDLYVSTKYVYENLHANSLSYHPDIDGMVQAIQRKDLKGITERMGNVLETVTEKEYPVITQLKEIMKEKGALNALMSGSGPTVFGIFEKKEDAERACEAIREKNCAKQIFVTQFVDKEKVQRG